MTRVCFFIILITVTSCSSIKLNKGITWKYAKCSENVVREITYTYNEDSIKIPFLNHLLPKKKLDSICRQLLHLNMEIIETKGKSRLFTFGAFLYRDSLTTMSVVQASKINQSQYSYLVYIWELTNSLSEHSSYKVIYSPRFGAVYIVFPDMEKLEVAKVIKYRHLSKRKWSELFRKITGPYLKIECF